jgi:hypothetical protein
VGHPRERATPGRRDLRWELLDTCALKADRFTVVNLEVPGDEQAVPRGYHCVMPGCDATSTAYLPPVCKNHKVEVEMVEDLI